MQDDFDDSPKEITPWEPLLATFPFAISTTRREFILRMAVTSAALHFTPKLLAATPAQPKPLVENSSTQTVTVKLTINGKACDLTIDPRVTLLDALRDRLMLCGTKKGCDHGQCGACTVLVNGRRINSCLSLAVMHDGDEITTIEGLEQNGQLHPMQAAFIEHDGFQCGYCTPGQICSAVALLKEGHAKSDAETREWMSGNICRCGAYTNIVAAIREAKNKTTASA